MAQADQAVIRVATEDDLDIVLDLGEKFFNSVPWPDNFNWCRETVIDTFYNFSDLPNAVILVEPNGQGMAGAILDKHFFTGDLIGSELFWWVEPEHRKTNLGKQLWEALERWAKLKGCKHFAMIALDGSNGKAMGDLYKKNGYTSVERLFMKEL